MNQTDAPLISIIVAVFNGRATLQQCIDSVVQQTYPNRELIIIDGASRDGTVELLNANRNRIAYWISEPDRGIYNAWNKGLTHAKGEWICFLGADDYLWEHTVLERMVAHLKMLPVSIRVAYGQIQPVSDDGQSLPAIGEPWAQVNKFFTQYMSIPHVGTMHRRSLFEQHGKFDETFYIAGDYEFLMRELKTGDAVFIPDIIATGVRTDGVSTILANRLTVLRETWHAQRMHGQFLPGRILLKETGREYFRLLVWRILGERLAKKLHDLRRRINGLPPQ